MDAVNAPEAAQLATARAFLRLLTPTRSASARSPSVYTLKHDAERWGRAHGASPYVSSDAVLAAAVELRYPIWHRRGWWPTAHIGVSGADLRRLRPPPPGGPRTDCTNVVWLADAIARRRASGHAPRATRLCGGHTPGGYF